MIKGKDVFQYLDSEANRTQSGRVVVLKRGLQTSGKLEKHNNLATPLSVAWSLYAYCVCNEGREFGVRMWIWEKEVLFSDHMRPHKTPIEILTKILSSPEKASGIESVGIERNSGLVLVSYNNGEKERSELVNDTPFKNYVRDLTIFSGDFIYRLAKQLEPAEKETEIIGNINL